MKAIVLEEHGDISQLQYKEKGRKQELASDEIYVEIRYCALNHLDLWLRKGGTGDKFNLPTVPGSDISGVVAETGADVTHVKKGDAVLIYPGVSCGHCEMCANGWETRCPEFQIIGYQRDGGYAEGVVVPSKNVLRIPSDYMDQWAAVPISYVTAWNALVTKGGLNVNDTVAVWGAAGGLGFAALSIVRGFGAEAIAIVGSEEKKAFLRERGFDGHVVVRSDDILKDIRSIAKKGVSLVLDQAGRATWNHSLKMLGRGGRLACCGITTGPKTETDLRYIFGKQLSISGSWMGDKKDLLEVITFLERQPELLPYIDRTYPLKEAGDAQKFVEEGNHNGKVLLEI
ncbi:alcohol dehydrogenase catalytic domain-containing protein [Alteribacillus iranensis]|uniref:D-arabinose 1-dehydrogenase, Zn-dependent alcohol dehydrogenase family n=1 Tax=Alteribacillus iranensis TaxID=930128 RepID=A0A1I2BPF5_9BACI|nr:alcohol dehydrogenase catalytic domain-containing protein [Alteribacillus iranensis]SFE57907.1 D-arabinose 1-dehydrogenase, Zn-dependent alcohol dehydrogenase family [Alteribacillus iranensis]